MKAAVYTRYGPPDVVQIIDVEKPVPNENEVLIRVCAAAANPLDWHVMRGEPYLVRAMAGLRKPKVTRLGVDLAGQVEAIGANVTQFKPGDAVFGVGRGAFAEYVCTDQKKIALKPGNVTFEQAAAVPVAAITALQGLRDKGRIQPGQKVLINGAAGGVGTFAVQIAKAFGAEVAGVCSTRNVDLVRSIGADHAIDYTQQDFTRSGQRFDLILDNVGNHSLPDCRRVLAAKGTLVLIGGGWVSESAGRWIGPLALPLKALLASPFVSQQMVWFMATINQDGLAVLKELMETEKVTPVIDKRYRFSELPQAIRYLEEGHARGKVVITLEDNNPKA